MVRGIMVLALCVCVVLPATLGVPLAKRLDAQLKSRAHSNAFAEAAAEGKARTEWVTRSQYWYPNARDTTANRAYAIPGGGNPIIPLTARCADTLTTVITQLGLSGDTDRYRMIGVAYWGPGDTDCYWASSSPVNNANAVTACSARAAALGGGPSQAVQQQLPRYPQPPYRVCAAARLVQAARNDQRSLSCMAERKPADRKLAASCGTCQRALPEKIAYIYNNFGVPTSDGKEVRTWENAVVSRFQEMVSREANSRRAYARQIKISGPLVGQHIATYTAMTQHVTDLNAAYQRCLAITTVQFPVCLVPTDVD